MSSLVFNLLITIAITGAENIYASSICPLQKVFALEHLYNKKRYINNINIFRLFPQVF